jgi:hypothetical protein
MLSGTEVQLQLVNDSCSELILDGIEELQSAHGDVKNELDAGIREGRLISLSLLPSSRIQ